MHSAAAVADLLRDTGFSSRVWLQTPTRDPAALTAPEPARQGHGAGLLVAVRAERG
ncbi:MAG: hypothetical protein GWO02_19910 [Gammaproteobacteria bacterium]|nr:hypothetical protein [Gammaproteobacteria bacterium]